MDHLARYCVALANEGGGVLILGVTDRRPREIVGTEACPEPGEAATVLFQKLRHRVRLEELCVDGKRVVLVHIPPHDPGDPWHLNGTYLKREGDSISPIYPADLQRLLRPRTADFSATTCTGATTADLSAAAIQEFRKRWATRTDDPRKLQWSDQETLVNAELLNDNGLSYAALILFGTKSGLSTHLAQAEVIFEFKTQETSGPANQRIELREGFFLWHEDLWQVINLRNDRQSYQDGFFRYEVPTFDEQTIREAVLNAVAHRSYESSRSVFVRQTPQRLEITSPGGFPEGVTADNILEQQNPRNRRLAEALSKCGLIERSGQGVNLMFEACIRQAKQLPDFRGTTPYEVKVSLDGQVRNPAFIRFLDKIGKETLQSFSTADFLVLDLVQQEKAISPDLKERLPFLRNAAVIEAVGSGRGQKYILSRRFYHSIGRPGVYTRIKGLDQKANKALLLQHLNEAGSKGSHLSELQQVLPQLSRRQLQGLLQQMRSAGLITLVGVTRNARWVVHI